MLTIRPARWPQDVPALSALDASFTTDTIFRLVQDGLTFRLTEEPVTPPLHKRYAFNPSDPKEQANWNHSVVAEDAGQLVGFAAAQYTAWNRRVILCHLYIAPAERGQGLGTWLLASVEAFAQATRSRCLWVETQNVNFHGVRFYLRAGFTLCGLDTSLYDPDGPVGREVALFLQRPVPFSGTRLRP